jgi:hypothetical protein
MHSRFASITAIAVVSFLPAFWQSNAHAEDSFDGQEILIECPVWRWDRSQTFGVYYELCFDDVDHCTVAEIGGSVCIPSLGFHDVWVTAIDLQGGEVNYYDGDVVRINRVENADFDGDGVVGMTDLGIFFQFFGKENASFGDLTGDGVVGMVDYSQFLLAYGKCVNESGTVYEPCVSSISPETESSTTPVSCGPTKKTSSKEKPPKSRAEHCASGKGE